MQDCFIVWEQVYDFPKLVKGRCHWDAWKSKSIWTMYFTMSLTRAVNQCKHLLKERVWSSRWPCCKLDHHRTEWVPLLCNANPLIKPFSRAVWFCCWVQHVGVHRKIWGEAAWEWGEAFWCIVLLLTNTVRIRGDWFQSLSLGITCWVFRVLLLMWGMSL